ncbi:MAG: methyltransferase domain-containing protein [Terriglobia bacterium]
MENTKTLRHKVREAYSEAAERPDSFHIFPVGRRFAESIGYPAHLLSSLPVTAVDAFAGVSNVSLFAEVPRGAIVLDLGCGAGLDSLVAAQRTGSQGMVIGVDFSAPMLNRARLSAREAQIDHVTFFRADAESLPLRTSSVDLALVNGIFNLNPAREVIFRELRRVVRRGGSVYAAELILSQPLSREERESEQNWFA